MCTTTPVAFSARRSLALRAADELLPEPLLQVAGLGARLNLLARAREDRASRLDRERVVAPPRELVHRGQVAQPHCASAFSARTGTSAQFSS